MIDLSTLSGNNESAASGVSREGHIVAWSTNASGARRVRHFHAATTHSATDLGEYAKTSPRA
jgi:hypothetical protein